MSCYYPQSRFVRNNKILMFVSPPCVLTLASNMALSISVVASKVFDYFRGSIAWEQQIPRTCFNLRAIIQEIISGYVQLYGMALIWLVPYSKSALAMEAVTTVFIWRYLLTAKPYLNYLFGPVQRHVRLIRSHQGYFG